MSKAKSALRILTATSQIQGSIADILEAKAMDMESLRRWLMHSVRSSSFDTENDQVDQTVHYHHLMLEILQGVAKLESALASHMRILLEEQEVIGGNSFDGMVPFGDDA